MEYYCRNVNEKEKEKMSQVFRFNERMNCFKNWGVITYYTHHPRSGKNEGYLHRDIFHGKT